MIDICIALDQSVSPHTGVRAIQNTGVFLQAVFQTPRPHSFFLDRGSAAKTLITQYTIPPAAQANVAPPPTLTRLVQRLRRQISLT